ncbi:hypothetical protein BHE74_00042095 [Ensete ventricosum]|nr:hypothetical protein BHE74_00042095 [Ensete ventricosum]
MAQGSDKPLSQFVGRFTSQVQGIPDLHPSLAIQAFLTGLRPSRFLWSLIERSPATLPEMLQWAHQYMAAETSVAGKRKETKRPRGEQSRGHPAPPPKRREDKSGIDVTKEDNVAFTGNTDMTLRNVVTCSTKLKTLSGTATCADMSANNPPSLTIDPPETRHLGPKARSRSKSTSSSTGQPRVVTAPRHEKLMRDPRSGRGHCMTKTLTATRYLYSYITRPILFKSSLNPSDTLYSATIYLGSSARALSKAFTACSSSSSIFRALTRASFSNRWASARLLCTSCNSFSEALHFMSASSLSRLVLLSSSYSSAARSSTLATTSGPPSDFRASSSSYKLPRQLGVEKSPLELLRCRRVNSLQSVDQDGFLLGKVWGGVADRMCRPVEPKPPNWAANKKVAGLPTFVIRRRPADSKTNSGGEVVTAPTLAKAKARHEQVPSQDNPGPSALAQKDDKVAPRVGRSLAGGDPPPPQAFFNEWMQRKSESGLQSIHRDAHPGSVQTIGALPGLRNVQPVFDWDAIPLPNHGK